MTNARLRRVASYVSVAGSVVILAAKLGAWRLTGSSAVLSDALESIVNVVAALAAVYSIRFAAQPADADHPYGHGKIEYFAAAFEGGLVTLAAVMIVFEAGHALWRGVELRALDVGLAVTAAAGAANLLLGTFLVRAGRRVQSPTLIADGHHVLSDVWTTAGVLVGLGLVRVTGVTWLDPVAALGVGLLLAWTGAKLFLGAAGALLDQDDPELRKRLVAAFNEVRVPGLVELHRLRAIRHGAEVHVDAHVNVPEHWTVREAHDASLALERELKRRVGGELEFVFHLDPCRREGCARCDLELCPHRQAAFEARRPVNAETAVEEQGPPH